MTPTLYLASSHPVAPVAASHCATHTAPLIGGVACGRCWETAIRDDERFAIENSLPREITTDPFLIDLVAVDRAIHGLPVNLTSAERVSAVGDLRSRGTTIAEIARLLHLNQQAVWRELQALDRINHSKQSTGAA